MSQTEGSVYLSTGAFVYNIHIEYLSNGSNGNIYNLLNKSFEYLSNCPSTYLVMNLMHISLSTQILVWQEEKQQQHLDNGKIFKNATKKQNKK